MSQLKRGLGMATWQSLGTGFLTPAKGNRLVAKRRSPAEWCAIWGFLCVKCLHGPPGSLPTVTRLVSRQRARDPIHAEHQLLASARHTPPPPPPAESSPSANCPIPRGLWILRGLS